MPAPPWIDTAPWRSSRDFRLTWTSGTVTLLGSVFTMTAIPLQIADLTGSPLAVGAVGAVELVPTIVFGLYGGALADRADRRTVALVTEIALAALSALLLANALLGTPALWPLYAAAGLAAALQGLQQPSLEAMIPRIVPHDQLVAAGALLSLRWSVAGLAGPAAAGLVIATAGAPVAYLVDVATFLVSIALLAAVRPVPSGRGAEAPRWREFKEGARYAARRPDLLGTYLADLAATAFALPAALFPFLARELDAMWALGLLYSASAAGSLIAAATSGWTDRVHRHGRFVLLSTAAVGIAMIGAAAVPSLWAVLPCLVVAGAANWTGDTFRSAIWNQSIPDELRGRAAGLEMLIGSAGPALGDLRAGALAARQGIRAALRTGGLVCLTSAAALSAALPALWRYDRRTDPHVQAVRASAQAEEAAR
ncbi:MFS transporter [Streptomyces sp. SP17BM10]|uniref:MFS transporter n=1 Tax=Streptomyces sp. SP17BM10 TaxID=3002530 RepID=UPI002E7A424D|nr:MFS transporter [Streptomyces sp. SP17BM10]MEE1783836.1 MFS transporter [Streptomyces sp. SP17BM10]